MSCSLEKEGSEVYGVLIFKRAELLYDIKNYAYIEGSVLETDSAHVRHSIQDVGEEGNVDRITRVLDLTIAKCREMLYPYTKHSLRRKILDDKLREPRVYGIVLKLPQDFSQTTLNLLEGLVHEYVVCSAVCDWMSITNPGKAQTWASKAEDAESEIRVQLQARISRTRRRLHPF